MKRIEETSVEDFENSIVSACFVPAEQEDTYLVKVHANAPERPAYMVGSVGDAHGAPELFRLLLPIPLAVGNRGTIISLKSCVLQHSYPTFVPKHLDIEKYYRISPHFGAPTLRVGRLVAIAWLPQPDETVEVDHLDGNPSNDVLENLEWVSHSVNLKRGRHSKPKSWAPDDFVLMLHEGHDPLLVHPSKVTAIVRSRNASHVLRRGTRRSINGWYPCLNPSRAEALAFVESLPFGDNAAYVDAVEDLLDGLEMD